MSHTDARWLARHFKLSAAAAGVCGLIIGCQRELKQHPTPPTTSVPIVSVTDTLSDPLNADRPIEYDSSPRAKSTNWVTARPAFQYSHLSAQRGGVNPCAPQEVDTSAFYDWTPLTKGKFIAPREGAIDASGHFSLIIHFQLGNVPSLY